MSRRDAATVLALCSWLKKRIKVVEDRARLAADVAFPGEDVAATVDGTVVAHTKRVSARPREPFTILDEARFTEWVAARWPTEVEPRVRPSFLVKLAEDAEHHGGVVIDQDGEVCEFVKLNDPNVYTATYLAKDAEKVLEPLLAGLALDDLPGYIEHDDEPHDLDKETPL